MNKKVGILGAGAWGITLCSMLHENKCDITLWEFDPKQAEELSKKRKLDYFSYVKVPKSVEITNNLKQCCEKKDFLLLVLPSHTLRKVARNVASLKIDLTDTIIITATKGIENETLMRMSEILEVELPEYKDQIVVLSGPSIAREVIDKQPTAVTAASINLKAAEAAQKLFTTPYFRTYTHSDVIGVEIGGALKNVFAIASGICDGLNLGDNTKSALITRGMRELVQLGIKLGGKLPTFFGLTGLGDLIVTCSSKYSRNRTLGEKIGKGETLSQAEKEIIMIAEGVKTTRSAYKLAQKHRIDLPIIEQVYQVLFYNKSPKKAVEDLMLRKAKPETNLEISGMTI
ncbi:MAG: NAD(P)-dependent glycerol-3-phosphate dehydrogenase [Endomicrobiales bacterium]|nr:NAD(P)-dependent glycerol-3-phosphate dehydrogenase [Endomicrobiales bacterium]